MTRALSTSFRTTLESSNASDLAIIFATVTHPDLETAVTVNSDIMDYVLGGVTFLGAAFNVSLLQDDDAPPVGKVSIPNVDRAIGEAVQLLSTPPKLKLEIYPRSDFDNANPRTPLGTPSVQYSADGLFLRNISCDALGFTADLSTYDIASEPWPAIRSTVNRLPGLFARAPIAS